MKATQRCVRRLFASIALAQLAPLAGAQFSPPPGPIDTQLSMTSASTLSSGPYTLTRELLTFPDRLRLTVDRPGSAPDFVRTVNVNASDTTLLTYAFIGSDSLLLFTSVSNNVTVVHQLELIELEGTGAAVAHSLWNRNDFVTDNANAQVRSNADGSCIFTPVFLSDSAINDSFELDVWRTDTGAHLCGMGPRNRASGDQFRAEVTGTGGTADGITITFDQASFPDQEQSCALPAADLDAAPQPLTFSEIVNTATATETVDLFNSGTDVVTVSAIGPSAHFSAPGFAAATLDPGGSIQVAITFAPGGTSGTFDEVLPITRTPPVGIAELHCRGEARTPVPRIAVTGSGAFGSVNLGSSSSHGFTIASTGDLPLDVTAFTPPTNADFAVAGFPPLPTTLAPGATATFTITFSPTVEMPYTDSFSVTSNDPATPVTAIGLAGVGHVPRPLLTIDPTVTSLDYGEVEVGYRFGKGVRIQNRGDADLQFDVSVTGDSRFGYTLTPDVPGPGSQATTTVVLPASSSSGPFSEIIVRATFDALAPSLAAGDPDLAGSLILGNITPDDPGPATRTIGLEGRVVDGKTVDVAMVLDRSGSMSEPSGADVKVTVLRRASRLFVDLLRKDVGDRIALVQYNTQADVLQDLIALTDAPTTGSDPGDQAHVKGLIDGNLAPSGSTSIAAGLIAGFGEVDPTLPANAGRDVRAVLVVSDGKENTPATLPDGSEVNLEDLVPPSGVGVHSLGLGEGGPAGNIDLGKLDALANLSAGGTSMATGDLSGLSIFDVEKFFLQVATTILGQTAALDPIYSIAPGQSQATDVELIAADREVTFVTMFREGTLPYRVTAPDGTTYPTSAPPAGFGQAEESSPHAHILRLQLPTSDPPRYAGIWRLEVFHGGKVKLGDKTIEVKDSIPYAVAVSVGSNLRLLGLLSPAPTYTGDPILVTAFLSEEGVPVLGASVDATARFPNGATPQTFALHDDGAHNDGGAGDGEYAGNFTSTAVPGPYSFRVHAFGASARGGTFTRETTLGRQVVVEGAGEDDDGRPGGGGGGTGGLEECCKHITRYLLVIVILLLLLLLLLFWIRRAPGMRQAQMTVRREDG